MEIQWERSFCLVVMMMVWVVGVRWIIQSLMKTWKLWSNKVLLTQQYMDTGKPFSVIAFLETTFCSGSVLRGVLVTAVRLPASSFCYSSVETTKWIRQFKKPYLCMVQRSLLLSLERCWWSVVLGYYGFASFKTNNPHSSINMGLPIVLPTWCSSGMIKWVLAEKPFSIPRQLLCSLSVLFSFLSYPCIRLEIFEFYYTQAAGFIQACTFIALSFGDKLWIRQIVMLYISDSSDIYQYVCNGLSTVPYCK